MSSSTTYYLDINSNFRNTEEFLNPSDFSISFQTNTSTGYFIEGESLNPESMFENCSIDPDFYTSNIDIKNGVVDNIKLFNNSVYICGNMALSRSVIFSYKNTGIVAIPTVKTNSVFLIRFDIVQNNPIPYTFNWCLYTDCNTGPSRTSRSSFKFDLNNNIYFCFDTTALTNDIYIFTNNSQPTTFLNIINNTTPIQYNTKSYVLPVKELILLYLTQNGNIASFNNANWGYHKLRSNYGLDKSLDNGRFGLNIDQGNNLLINFNTNPRDPAMGPNNSLALLGTYNYLCNFNEGGTLFANLTRNPYSSIILNNSYSNKDLFVVNVWSPYIFAFGSPANSQVIFMENKSTGAIRLFSNRLPLFSTGTSNPVINQFVYINKDLYSIYTEASTNPNNIPLRILGYDYTGQGINVLATTPFGVGNYTYSTSISSGTNIYTFLRTTEQSYNVGELQAYEFNTLTNNLTLLSTGPRPVDSSLLHCISECYMRNGIMYIVVCEITTTFYGNNTPQKAYVYSFNIGTNSLTLLSSFSLLSDTAQCLVIEQRGLNDYLYISYTLNSTLHIIDLTDPSNPIVASTLNIVARQTIIYIRYIDNHYYCIAAYPSISYINVDDVYNPIFIKNYNGQLPVLNIDELNNAYLLRFNVSAGVTEDIEKVKLLDDVTIYSEHYNQNISKTIVLLDNNLTNFNTITINNNLFLFTSTDTNLYIYNITSIENSSFIDDINISLTSYPKYIELNYYNNKVYIYFQLTNNVIVYSLDYTENIFSNINYIQTINATDTINNLTTVTTTSPNVIINLPYDFIIYSLEDNSFNLINTVNVSSPTGTIIGIYGTYINYLEYGINGLVFTTYDTSAVQGYIYIYNINDFTNTSLIGIRTLANRSVTTNINNFDIVYTNTNKIIIPARLITPTPTSLSTITQVSNFTNPFTHDPDIGGTDIYFTATGGSRCISGVSNPTYDSIIIANSIPSFLYTGSFEYLNIYGASSTLTTLSANTIRLPGIANWLKAKNINNKTIGIVLCDKDKLFLYDLTNITVAINFQDLKKIEKQYVLNPSFGNSAIHLLLKDGTPSWTNFLGTSLNQNKYFGVDINISNIINDKVYQYLYVCGNWNTQIQLYNTTSTGYLIKNEINNSIPSVNGFVAKCTIDGNWQWILPTIGDGIDTFERLDYLNSLDSISLVGYTTSTTTFIYDKQISGIFVQPSLIQNIINNTSITSAYLININKDGILQWVNNIFTNEQFRNVYLYDIVSTNDKIIVVGTSNSNKLNYSDVSNDSNIQVLYSNINYTNQYECIVYVFSSSGYYIQSNLIELPTNSTIKINDIKVEENLNRIIVFPNIRSTTPNPKVNIFNKDGTLAYINNIQSNINYNLVIQYLLDSSYVETDGNIYSQVVYRYNPTYEFDYNNLQNYNVFIFGNFSDQEINRNYSIRKNYFNSSSGATLLLNTIIDTSKVVKLFNSINGLTGSINYYGMHLGKSSLASIINYDPSSINFINNTIISTGYYQPLDTGTQYYFNIPFLSSTGYVSKIVKINNITVNNNGNYVFYLNNVNDLRTSLPTGSFYNPYITVNNENRAIFYNIQFFPGSIFSPQYYNINVLSLTLPNRPLLNVDYLGGVRYIEDLPFIYLSIYNVNDDDEYDPDIVNVVYDNTPLADVKPFPLFLIPVYAQGTDSNFVTYSSDLTAIIKFTASFTNIRIRILDPDGNPLVFDQALTKPNDFTFLDGVLPTYFTNTYLRIALTKR